MRGRAVLSVLVKSSYGYDKALHHKAGADMPTYEYHCHKCDRTFVVYQTIKEHDTAQVQCPHCQSSEVEQRFTSFVAVTSKKS
jgi:putative FmdB family regulatory protein